MKTEDKSKIVETNRHTVLCGICIGMVFCAMIVYLMIGGSIWFGVVLILLLISDVIQTYISHKQLVAMLDNTEKDDA